MLGSWARTPLLTMDPWGEREGQRGSGAVPRALGDGQVLRPRQGQDRPGSHCLWCPSPSLLHYPTASSTVPRAYSWGLGKPRWGGEAWAHVPAPHLYLASCFSGV